MLYIGSVLCIPPVGFYDKGIMMGQQAMNNLPSIYTLGNQNAQLLSERPIHEYGTSNQGIKHGIVTIRSHFSDHRSQETV